MDQKIQNLTFEGQRRHLKAGWDAVRVVVSNQIPATGADYAFLHSLMTDLANVADSFNDLGEDVREAAKAPVTVPITKAIGLWHCCNIILQNELEPNEGLQANIMELMAILAPKIDAIQEGKRQKSLILGA